MKYRKWISFGLLAIYAAALVGCDQKNVVTDSDKTGLTAQERADKRGK